MLTFPEVTLLNYPYIVIIFYFHYKMYSNEVKYLGVYKFLRKFFPLLYLCLLGMWLFDCKNTLTFKLV